MKMLQSQTAQREIHQLNRAQELQNEQIIPLPYSAGVHSVGSPSKRAQLDHLIQVELRMSAKMKQIKKKIDYEHSRHQSAILEQKPISNSSQDNMTSEQVEAQQQS